MAKVAPRRILIIEDDPDVGLLLHYRLSAHGYHVARAASGNAILAQVAEFAPQIILLDYMLPGEDGISICRRLKASPQLSAVPVLMVSSNDDPVVIAAAKSAGVYDYLPKRGFLKAVEEAVTALLA
jgi:two-component system, OmpR family, phosphate regulon response regulator PhoB